MYFSTNAVELRAELLDEIRLFDLTNFSDELTIAHTMTVLSDEVKNDVEVSGRTVFSAVEPIENSDIIKRKRQILRAAKRSVYRALSRFTGINHPWGSLTGIRPTKLFYELLSGSGDGAIAEKQFVEDFDVSLSRAALVREITENQQGYLSQNGKKVNLYVHVPFCPSKCRYCSFVTEVPKKGSKIADEYLELLCREIAESKDIIAKCGLELNTVYVGGGTPTFFSADQLSRLLDEIGFFGGEFTVEAGRPDTVTAEKLRVMKDRGVTRVCVNPQSLCDNTLKAIGREHNAADFVVAFELVKSFGLKINTDTIAGLEAETLEDFACTLEKLISLAPDNITVHTLSRKNGSRLKNSEAKVSGGNVVSKMVELSLRRLKESGYLPYYLYRQKDMSGNLENIGYAKPNAFCINNIVVMEEAESVMACGAGAISKAIRPNGLITRHANLRDVRLYINEFESRLLKKRKFFENQFTSIDN